MFRKMANFKDYTTICSSAPSEILSLIALRSGNKIIKTHLDTINSNLHLLDNFFAGKKDLLKWHKPKAGTIALVEILFDFGATKFAEKTVNDTGIMLLPSTVYGFGDRHFRLGFGRKNLPEVLKVFDKYLTNNF